mmetsp:Transcript_72032/g.123788  ORF Transcript_72032/g.123788 Transcript_72032/m.123788 type:complete len:333 (+) Transcript_72032:138-1136(+)
MLRRHARRADPGGRGENPNAVEPRSLQRRHGWRLPQSYCLRRCWGTPHWPRPHCGWVLYPGRIQVWRRGGVQGRAHEALRRPGRVGQPGAYLPRGGRGRRVHRGRVPLPARVLPHPPRVRARLRAQPRSHGLPPHGRERRDRRLLLGLRAHAFQADPLHNGQVCGAGHGVQRHRQVQRHRLVHRHRGPQDGRRPLLRRDCGRGGGHHQPPGRLPPLQGEQEGRRRRGQHAQPPRQHHRRDRHGDPVHPGPRRSLRHDWHPHCWPVRHLRQCHGRARRFQVPLPRAALKRPPPRLASVSGTDIAKIKEFINRLRYRRTRRNNKHLQKEKHRAQ